MLRHRPLIAALLVALLCTPTHAVYLTNTAVTVHVAIVDATDGSAVTTGTPAAYVTIDGGTQAPATNALTHEGNGQWSLVLTADEMNGTSIGVLVTETGSIPQNLQISTTGTLDVNVAQVSDDATAADNLELACDNYSATRGLAGTALPNAAADAAGGLCISDTGGVPMDDILINVANILADTGADIPAAIAALNDFDPTNDIVANVNSVALLDAGALSAIADGVLDEALSGHTTAGTAGKAIADIEVDATAILADTAEMQPLLPASTIAAASDVTATSVVPVSQVPVPKSRTWKATRSTAGLVGDRSLGTQIGAVDTYAVDFVGDLPTNGRLNGITSWTIKSGTAGGVTFDTDNDGVDKTQAKCKFTAVTAGTYVITVIVTYDDVFGGGTTECDVTLVVND